MSAARNLHNLNAQAIFDSIRTWDDVRALVERGLFDQLGLRGGFDGGAALAAVWLALSDDSSDKK